MQAFKAEPIEHKVKANFTFTVDHCKILRFKDMENSNGQMEDTTSVTLKIPKCTVMVKCHGMIQRTAKQRTLTKVTCLLMSSKVTES